jgi:maltose phosphorylase
MAGTWMSIVEGFGGMRVKDGKLSFSTKIPKQWKGYSFKVNFRDHVLKVNVTQEQTYFEMLCGEELEILCNDKPLVLESNVLKAVS